MARGEAEFGPPIVDKVIFRIKTPVLQLDVFIGVIPILFQTFFNQRDKGRKKGAPNILGQFKVFIPISGAAVIHKNPPHTTRAVAVWNIEIFICPVFEFGIKPLFMGCKVLFEGFVKMRRVFVIFETGVQVRTPAKPPGMGRPEHACVHMDGRTMRILHMGDKRYAACPETGILFHARYAFARGHCVLRLCA